ncbi:ATP-binding protein [Paenibacillus urinalis]|uniref:ATP-binding protein n=1 Tax=Paenibacillus urinalis TaxID=521520 RepID=A0AAX3N0U5_9BACL|nr:ATP-binding protein [Paenibacillus urinalis]WDH83321.1 ATP-binding protein [Paenibacillus urinalis]
MKIQNSIGVVNKVFTNKIVIEVPDTSKLNNNFLGDIYICDGINTIVTIHKSKEYKFIYQLSSLYEMEKPFDINDEVSKFSGKAFFEAVPLGEIYEGKFEFGLSMFPMIGSDVFLTVNHDINLIFQPESSDFCISLGYLATQNSFSPRISIDKLLTHHTSILGNTGSGKSTTVRKLLNEVSSAAAQVGVNINNANFVVFDVHDEYGSISNSVANKIDVIEELSIPLNTLTVDDWVNLVQPSSAVQFPILLNGLRWTNLIENTADLNSWIKVYCALELYNNVQTEPVAKRTKIMGLLRDINDANISRVLAHYNPQYANFQGSHETTFKETLIEYIKEKSSFEYENCKEQISLLLESAEYSITKLKNLEIGLDMTFLVEESKGNSQVRSYCSTLMTRISNLIATYSKSIFDDDSTKVSNFCNMIEFNKGFTILNFSSMDDSDLLFFSGYLLRFVFKKQKENRTVEGEKKLFHFIFDEAHKYISEKDEENIKSTKIFEQIAKEGRKFGVFMILASQRPGEISKTVLSQCNNFILHRIRNNVDLEQMRKSIPYLNDSQLIRISFLRTGSALLVGEAFSIPMEIIIDGKDYGEISKSYLPSEIWRVQN